MTAVPASPPLVPLRSTSVHRGLYAAVGIGLVAVIIEAVALAFAKTTSSGHYRYAADYWLTAAALPHAAAGIILLPTLRAFQGARDGRLGAVAIWLNTASLLVLAGICGASIVVQHEIQGGPTYLLGGAVSFLATALFAAASWRSQLLPRWLLAIWPIVWIIGSFFAVSASPLLLGVFYIVLLVLLREHRATGRDAS